MNSISKLTLAFSLLLSLFGQSLLAQTANTNGSSIKAITTAVPFLLICPDSRSGGMGETGVAYADNAYATHHNLSGLAFAEHKFGFAMNYTPWLRRLVPDINLGYLSGYYNISERAGVVAASLRFFSLGKIIFTDEQATEVGEFNASEFALDAGYTRKITSNLSMGAALRFIYSNLAGGTTTSFGSTKPGLSFAGDINLLYTKDFKVASKSGKDLPITLRYGLNISNIGAKISYTNTNQRDFIPTNLKTGLLMRFNVDEYNSVAIGFDLNKLMVPSAGGQSDKALLDGMFTSFGDAAGIPILDENDSLQYNDKGKVITEKGSRFKEEMREINLSIGMEYWYNKLFAARVGYFYEAPDKGNRHFITIGAGLRYRVFGLDFAYLAALSQNHPLQNTLRFSLTFDFNPAESK